MTYPTECFLAKAGARYDLAIGMVAKNTATTRHASPDLFQTVSARACTFRRTSATWTSMWSVLKTKALSLVGQSSGLAAQSIDTAKDDRNCQSSLPCCRHGRWNAHGATGHRGDDRASQRRRTTWLCIARPQAPLSYSKHPPPFWSPLLSLRHHAGQPRAYKSGFGCRRSWCSTLVRRAPRGHGERKASRPCRKIPL
jgi:hypothetical protein